VEYIRDPDVLRRMQIAFELAEAAEEMKRLTLKRQHHDATEEEIERMIVAWYQHRPGAELGDGDGVPDPQRFKELLVSKDD
jgi:hypothetical protein